MHRHAAVRRPDGCRAFHEAADLAAVRAQLDIPRSEGLPATWRGRLARNRHAGGNCGRCRSARPRQQAAPRHRSNHKRRSGAVGVSGITSAGMGLTLPAGAAPELPRCHGAVPLRPIGGRDVPVAAVVGAMFRVVLLADQFRVLLPAQANERLQVGAPWSSWGMVMARPAMLKSRLRGRGAARIRRRCAVRTSASPGCSERWWRGRRRGSSVRARRNPASRCRTGRAVAHLELRPQLFDFGAELVEPEARLRAVRHLAIGSFISVSARSARVGFLPGPGPTPQPRAAPPASCRWPRSWPRSRAARRNSARHTLSRPCSGRR